MLTEKKKITTPNWVYDVYLILWKTLTQRSWMETVFDVSGD